MSSYNIVPYCTGSSVMSPLKTSLALWNFISPLDWVIFFLVLFATGAMVIYGHTKKSQEDGDSLLDILLMGRRLTLPLFVATLVATWYGGIFGVTKIAFERGIYNFVTQGLFWYFSYIIFALFIVDKIEKYRALTLPDLVGKMFGPRSAKVAGVFNLFNLLPIAYVISLGLFLQLLFGGSLEMMMGLGVVAVLFYSLWGGLRSVVFSDLVQFVTMCVGVFLILLFSLSTYGGWSFLKSHLPPEHFSLTGGVGWGTTFIWGFIALSTLVDPNFYQRCFAALSPKVAKRGIFLSTLIWLGFDICTTLGAMYARAVIPEADSGSAYLTYAVQILPSGLRGFVLAGILATILSTLDSYLFLAGTTVGLDLLPERFKGRVALQRLGVVSVGGFAIAMALFFEGNIKEVWKTLGSYSAACLLLPVVCGYLFPGKIKDNQFLFSSLLGVAGTTWWRIIDRPEWGLSLDEFYVGVLSTSLGIGLYPFGAHWARKFFRKFEVKFGF